MESNNTFWGGIQIPMGAGRFAAGRGLVILFLFFLYGCPLMMPFMMGPMLSETMNKPEDAKLNEALAGLVRQGVSALPEELGTYERILVGDIIVTENFISSRIFREMLINELRSRNAWLVFDQDDMTTGGRQGLPSPLIQNQESTAVVGVRLFHAYDRLWLSIELFNGRSNRLLWSDLFDAPFSDASTDDSSVNKN